MRLIANPVFLVVALFLIVFLISLSFFYNQCFYDDAFEHIVLAAKMPWTTAFSSLISIVNRDNSWFPSTPKDDAYTQRISETILFKLMFPYFGFSQPAYFILKIIFLCILSICMFVFVFRISGNSVVALLFGLFFSVSTPVFLSMKYFQEFGIPSLCLTALSLFLLPQLFDDKRSVWKFILFLIITIFTIKMHRSSVVIPILTMLMILGDSLNRSKLFNRKQSIMLLSFSVFCIVSIIPLGLSKFHGPSLHLRNLVFLLFRNRPDYYVYSSSYEPHIGLSLYDISKWLVWLMVILGVMYLLKHKLSKIRQFFATKTIKDVLLLKENNYLFMVLSWFILEIFFLALPSHSDPRYLIHVLFPFLILVAFALNKFYLSIKSKKMLFIFVAVFIFSFSSAFGENVTNNIKILFSEDYASRAFYGTTKIVYSDKLPLQTIDDYDLYAQSLRNHKEFYANIAWSPLDSHRLQEKYVLVERQSQMQDNEEHVLLRTIELDNKIINRVLGWYYKRITGKEFPLEKCYLYKRIKKLTLAMK